MAAFNTLSLVLVVLVIAALGLLFFLIASSLNARPQPTTTTLLTSLSVPTTLINNTNGTQLFAPPQEIKNISEIYAQASLSIFACNYASECAIVRTSACFNNLASQQACINSSYANAYESSYEQYYSSRRVVCPQFFVLAEASCSCLSNLCNLVYKSGV